MGLIANAEVQSQRGAEAISVLKITSEPQLPQVLIGRFQIDAVTACPSQKLIGIGVPGVRVGVVGTAGLRILKACVQSVELNLVLDFIRFVAETVMLEAAAEISAQPL